MDDIGSLPVKRLPSPQLAHVRRRHVEVFIFTTRAEYIASHKRTATVICIRGNNIYLVRNGITRETH